MLDWMVGASTPTRAEASDVATAIYDGADAVMQSAEAAAGQYPIEAVAMMDRIISQTEQDKAYQSVVAAPRSEIEESPPHAVASASADLAQAIHAPCIVAYTSSGTTAGRIARTRPDVAILAVAPDENVARRLCLLRGAHSVHSQDIHTHEEMVEQAEAHGRSEGLAHSPDFIVVMAGVPFGTAGTTNNLRIV
jgi:pyruvate kinase